MNKNEIHIGNIIRQKVNQSSLSVAEFAKRINKTRENVYDIFKRSSIDTELLSQISKVLNYDFFKHFNSKEKASEDSKFSEYSDYYAYYDIM
ncbi:MAG: helix-turn-helix domain-containing protein [Prevotellaceae bacterium]|jgi:transcriptional regulator with XRE-family HTH domain|nr:helix-turn-helix domain-containing protein [Prevotellaceae bacterium]